MNTGASAGGGTCLKISPTSRLFPPKYGGRAWNIARDKGHLRRAARFAPGRRGPTPRGVRLPGYPNTKGRDGDGAGTDRVDVNDDLALDSPKTDRSYRFSWPRGGSR